MVTLSVGLMLVPLATVDEESEKNDIEQVRMSGNFGMHD
jgi:hypothetical protein